MWKQIPSIPIPKTEESDDTRVIIFYDYVKSSISETDYPPEKTL